MAQHSVELDIGAALAPPRSCPDCGSADLTAAVDAHGISFDCMHCDQSWVPVMGMLVPAPGERA